MKPDLLITAIKHADYPVWRATLRKYRSWFGKVIIYFSEHNRFPYFDHFIQDSLKDLDVLFLDPILTDWSTQDWRNVSTNEMIKHSTSEWVCSVEQDWFSNNWEKLLSSVEDGSKTADLIGWWQPNGKYIHPAFWFMKREMLERTTKDFSAHGQYDHFGWITDSALNNGAKILTTQDMGFKDLDQGIPDAFHLGGVNSNELNGLQDGFAFHRPEIFMVYNYWGRKANVIQDIKHLDLSIKLEDKLKKTFPSIDLENNVWSQFFQIV